MCLQEEFDDDEWNPCKAAGVCLMLMATCCEDDVVGHVLPFVKEHIVHTDWRFRDAAVMAFGRHSFIIDNFQTVFFSPFLFFFKFMDFNYIVINIVDS